MSDADNRRGRSARRRAGSAGSSSHNLAQEGKRKAQDRQQADDAWPDAFPHQRPARIAVVTSARRSPVPDPSFADRPWVADRPTMLTRTAQQPNTGLVIEGHAS